jgi:hypothetical protein
MRRILGVFIVVAGLGFGSAMPAMAYAPTPSAPGSPPGSPVAGAGQPVCRITDSRVTEVSGIVATNTGYVVINDSNVDRSRVKIFTLDAACKVTGVVSYPTIARDPEDVAVARDGTIWVADIGDNTSLTGGSGERRSTIALWSLAPGAREPVIHRLTYPDGNPRDAEAILLNGDGTPVIVTKQPGGEVYVPDGPLVPRTTEGVKLRSVGKFAATKTGTPNPLSFIGEATVTGGAVSLDGAKALVRTLSDAYEFDVADGDVAKAITSGKFRITPLPNEPQGEAISFTADGRSYVTVSDVAGPASILRYAPGNLNLARASAGPGTPASQDDEPSFFSRLSLQDITYIVAGVGVIGLLLVAVGIVGIRRSRAQRRATGAAGTVRASASVGGSASTGRAQDDDDLDRTDRGAGRGRARPEGRTGGLANQRRSDGMASGVASVDRRRPDEPTGTVYGGNGTVYGNGSSNVDRLDRRERGGYGPAERRTF